MAGRKIKGITLGTKLMLLLTALVLLGAGYVLLRLTGVFAS